MKPKVIKNEVEYEAALAHVAVATLAAAVPLVPILSRYIAVHARHGFVRDIVEVQYYSADLFGVLCASEHLWAWGWLRIGCRAEAELFPGLTVVLLARVITRIGGVTDVHAGVVENLFAADLAFLQDLYRRVNTEGHTRAAVTCPACEHRFAVDVSGGRLGE